MSGQGHCWSYVGTVVGKTGDVRQQTVYCNYRCTRCGGRSFVFGDSPVMLDNPTRMDNCSGKQTGRRVTPSRG